MEACVDNGAAISCCQAQPDLRWCLSSRTLSRLMTVGQAVPDGSNRMAIRFYGTALPGSTLPDDFARTLPPSDCDHLIPNWLYEIQSPRNPSRCYLGLWDKLGHSRQDCCRSCSENDFRATLNSVAPCTLQAAARRDPDGRTSKIHSRVRPTSRCIY
jgi:hypothetical protein